MVLVLVSPFLPEKKPLFELTDYPTGLKYENKKSKLKNNALLPVF